VIHSDLEPLSEKAVQGSKVQKFKVRIGWVPFSLNLLTVRRLIGYRWYNQFSKELI